MLANMRFSVFPVAVFLSSVSKISAFNDLSFPSTVAANTSVTLQVTNDLSDGSGAFDSQFNTYRVYLATTPPGLVANPACYLVASTAINTTNLTFEIPPSVGPVGDAYSIATEEFNTESAAAGPSGYEYSSTFELTNATGSWSEYELAGYLIGDADVVPCSAYNCARNCSQTFYPYDTNKTENATSTYNCIAGCPGVVLETVGESSVTLLTGTATSTSSTSRSTSTSATGSAASPTHNAAQHGSGASVVWSSVVFGVFAMFGI